MQETQIIWELNSLDPWLDRTMVPSKKTSVRRKTRIPFGPEVWESLTSKLGLAPRELDVLSHVFLDETESEIARGLGLSRHTIHTYIKRLFAKLGVQSRTQLIVQIFACYFSRDQHPPNGVAFTGDLQDFALKVF